MTRRKRFMDHVLLVCWLCLLSRTLGETGPSTSSLSSSSQARSSNQSWFPCSLFTFPEDQTRFAASLNQSASSRQRDLLLDQVTRRATNGSGSITPLDAQCQMVRVPLCHPSICSDQYRTVQLFVKRLVAKDPDLSATFATDNSTSDLNTDGTASTSTKNVFLVQGGPGEASVNLEYWMKQIYKQMNEAVNVYVMDHRGTGRSTRFDCLASQTTSTTSLGGSQVVVEEIPACAWALQEEFGAELNSFSVTSVATDIAQFIQTYLSNSQVFVYGVGHGTAVVERMMHLLPVDEIKGYVLDGVATSSGAPLNQFRNLSRYDQDFGQVAGQFLDVCSKDAFCGGKFDDHNVSKALQTLFMRLDMQQQQPTKQKEDLTSCIALIKEHFTAQNSSVQVSNLLRTLLGQVMVLGERRIDIPALVYRLNRCQPSDQQVVRFYLLGLRKVTGNATSGLDIDTSMVQLDALPTQSALTADKKSFYAPVLHKMIMFSELWEVPSADSCAMNERFTSSLMSNGNMNRLLSHFCAFVNDPDTRACQGVEQPSGTSGYPRIAYNKDLYFNRAAEIPANVSVLLLSGQLDAQTPDKYAVALHQSLRIGGDSNDAKRLLQFPQASHMVLHSTPQQGTNQPTCGMQILVSYLTNNGDLRQLDTSCMTNLAPLNFRLDQQTSLERFGAKEAFEAAFTGSPDSPDGHHKDLTDERNSYRLALIICSCLLALAIVVGGIAGWRLWRVSKLRDEETQLRRRQEVEDEQLALEKEMVLLQHQEPDSSQGSSSSSYVYFGNSLMS